jgi:hypothetical protein
VVQGRDNVIRIFVHAPKPIRIAEVQRVYRLDAAARQMVERSDRNRAEFVQSLIGRSCRPALGRCAIPSTSGRTD